MGRLVVGWVVEVIADIKAISAQHSWILAGGLGLCLDICYNMYPIPTKIVKVSLIIKSCIL